MTYLIVHNITFVTTSFSQNLRGKHPPVSQTLRRLVCLISHLYSYSNSYPQLSTNLFWQSRLANSEKCDKPLRNSLKKCVTSTVNTVEKCAEFCYSVNPYPASQTQRYTIITSNTAKHILLVIERYAVHFSRQSLYSFQGGQV